MKREQTFILHLTEKLLDRLQQLQTRQLRISHDYPALEQIILSILRRVIVYKASGRLTEQRRDVLVSIQPARPRLGFQTVAQRKPFPCLFALKKL